MGANLRFGSTAYPASPASFGHFFVLKQYSPAYPWILIHAFMFAPGLAINALQSMQFPVNFLRQSTANAIGLLQFFNAGGLYAFQSAKPGQETLPALGADTPDLLQTRTGASFSKLG